MAEKKSSRLKSQNIVEEEFCRRIFHFYIAWMESSLKIT